MEIVNHVCNYFIGWSISFRYATTLQRQIPKQTSLWSNFYQCRSLHKLCVLLLYSGVNRQVISTCTALVKQFFGFCLFLAQMWQGRKEEEGLGGKCGRGWLCITGTKMICRTISAEYFQNISSSTSMKYVQCRPYKTDIVVNNFKNKLGNLGYSSITINHYIETSNCRT